MIADRPGQPCRLVPLPWTGRGGHGRLRRLTGLEETARSWASPLTRILVLAEVRPRVAGCALAIACGGCGWLGSGPVAAIVAAVYARIALGVVIERRRHSADRVAANRAMDGLVALTAELRSGAEPGTATAAVLPTIRAAGAGGARTADRIAAAGRVAEVTGAGLADLLDRLEADVRALTRVRELAFAQAAGAQATAWLLAGLPIAGIALGYGIGADPLHELLHTRIGAACAGAALALQMAGLAWSQRLARATRTVV
jgi:tight adherence protein B